MAEVKSSEDTIAAIATPFGEGAVGIVRLSGPQAVMIADAVFFAKNKKSLAALKSFSFRYGWVKDETGRVLDEVIVSVMRAPRSYTREDVVEINAHGGAGALASVLDLILKKGARPAEPGEFTKRAFLNGRLDLAQAEAVCDVIRAKGDLARSVGLAQLSGDVSRRVGELRSALLEILADMEARIDFSEEETGVCAQEDFSLRLQKLSLQVADLLEKSFRGKVIREGLKVVIFGRPNVGKSSLLNALLKQERAIVTAIAGTTRDTIEELINIKGLTVRLIDTAGILEHRDEIEREALNRTRQVLKEADLVLFVLDGSSPLTEEDRALAAQVRDKKYVLIVNKCDQPQRLDLGEVAHVLPGAIAEVSALEGRSIDKVEELIWQSVFLNRPVFDEGVVISNARHIEILRRCHEFLARACGSFRSGLSLEFVSVDVKKALGALGELTGEVFNEEMLDVIFSKFCIGK